MVWGHNAELSPACISFVYIDDLLIITMFCILDSLITNLVLKSTYTFCNLRFFNNLIK